MGVSTSEVTQELDGLDVFNSSMDDDGGPPDASIWRLSWGEEAAGAWQAVGSEWTSRGNEDFKLYGKIHGISPISGLGEIVV